MGDELMAAGQAARVSRETGKRVAIVGAQGESRWHELWEGLDFITPCRGDVTRVVNGPGCRPYIRYPFTPEGHQYTGWRARDNRPVISEQLVPRLPREGYVVIEPTIKAKANPNKCWPYWQAVVDALPGVDFVQCRPPGREAGKGVLRGVRVVQTSTFVEALRVLQRAALYVGNEGGMHHAAAALDVPAVVFFGGSTSVEATGYPDHVNLGGTDPCGRWTPCAHCADVMNAITPASVVQAVKELLP